MTLRDTLAAGTFAVTGELSPPLDPVAAPVRRAAAALAGLVDAANVTDNPAATTKVSPLAASAWLIEAGLDNTPVLVGVMPPRSARALEHMHKNIPGVEVDDATFARLGDRGRYACCRRGRPARSRPVSTSLLAACPVAQSGTP
jgi:5,10-methylenetetrahydrofolate reductase